MKSPLHILHLEDDANDFTLIQAALKAGNIHCQTQCVQSREDFVGALKAGGIDLVLSDHSLPAFDDMAALTITRAQCPEMPFIVVSGTLGEELATDAVKRGATDYVVKKRLSRLVPAIQRAMREVKERAECRTAEEATEREREFSAATLHSLPGIFYLINDSLNFLRWNRNFERISGYSEKEFVQLSPLDFFTGTERSAVATKIKEGFENGRFITEANLTAKDGSLTSYFFTGEKTEINGKVGLIVTGIDISERNHLQAQFVEAQKMEVIGHLASGVAHDFNNILAVIMGYSDLAVEKLEPENPVRKNLETIRNAADRAAGLTRQLLVFSRNESVQPVVLDLNEVALETEKMLRRLIDENVELAILPGEKLGHITADPGHMGQLLMNLAVNARDAMPNGGKLTIATSEVTLDGNHKLISGGHEPANYILLSVSDTGTGMTDEVKARLFEAFFSTKPKGKGTGLGLATCQTIVNQNKGYIWVESTLGKGTTFKVAFPRVDKPLEPATEFFRKSAPPRGTETLLLVEDDPAVRHLASSVLELQGYNVLRANNGQDGLRVAREGMAQNIKLVITDVIMPHMGGKVMADWLKSSYPDIKILFTSGYTDDTIAHHGVLDEGVAFLPKPYTPASLARKVREILDHSCSKKGVESVL